MSRRAPHEVSVPVRWSDFDRYGHMMNANYIEVAQEARLAFARDEIYPRMPGFDVFVRHIDADFRAPVRAEETRELTVRSGIVRLGATSLTSRQKIARAGEAVACVIDTVQVLVDLDSGRPRKMTDAEREILEELIIDDADETSE